uniref:RING-type domain-containing protein n=1 Tax=viral metagenome TaxID=1070528 RepID=A0A6C0I022_9ZZZZ
MERAFKYCVDCKKNHDYLKDCYFCSTPQLECIMVEKNGIFACSSCSFILGKVPLEKNICDLCSEEVLLNRLPCNHKLCLQCCKNNYIGYTYTPRPKHSNEVTNWALWPYSKKDFNDYYHFIMNYQELLIKIDSIEVYTDTLETLMLFLSKEIDTIDMDLQKIIDYELDIFRCGVECGRLENMWEEWEQTKITGSKECPFCRSTLK